MKRMMSIWLAALVALTLLAGCGQQPASDAHSGADSGTSADAPEEMSEVAPVTGQALQDGAYPIEATSSSSMFRIVEAQLLVENGDMSATLTLSGTGYRCLYMGSGAEAESATEAAYIPYVEDAQGRYTYTVPVAALNQEIACAAYSIRKETWYDRTLVFDGASLPLEAWKNSSGLTDGDYTVDVTCTGGSGRATVSSPARLTVTEGRMVAVIQWSSPNYDYMLVDGVQYDPIQTEGNAAFAIPVAGLDRDILVTANTTAMSRPHEVDYTLRFFDASPAENPS